MAKGLNLKWARKIIAAKYFVVLTDKESMIALEGANPDRLNDVLMLQAQAASLQVFQEDLTGLIAAHARRLQELGEPTGITRSANATGKRKSATKRGRKPARQL